MNIRMSQCLNLASLVLGLAAAACAAYPVLAPFHGGELAEVSFDSTEPRKTPEFQQWQKTSDEYGRVGLFFVALGTVAAAQVSELRARSKVKSGA